MRRLKAKANPSEPPHRFALSPELLIVALLWVGLVGLLSFRLTRQGEIQFVSWPQIAAQVVLTAVLFAVLSLYAHRRLPDLWKRPRWMLFVVGLIFIIVLLSKLLDPWVPYLVPAPLTPALVMLFLGLEAGFIVNVTVALLLGLTGPPVGSLIAFAGGLVAMLCVLRLGKLSDLAIGGLEIGLVNALVYSAGASIWQAVSPQELLWAALSGPLSALLITGALPLAEQITQKTSPLGLMELLNPSHPLLELLRERAPGTYHHSFNVADLSESAAQAIGADPLLAKVGGYYHDIGKTQRPEFFLENQQNGVNPHDHLAPSLSKTILTAHIRDGLELGRRYGLKEDVLQFIPQHHGTSVIRYFYVKALREGQSPCSMDDFRYDAELPQTKEAAIVMLADGIEAASRALEDGARLEALVEETVREKLEDGQLSQAPLTLSDLEKIKAAFVATLHAMKHGRPVGFPLLKEK